MSAFSLFIENGCNFNIKTFFDRARFFFFSIMVIVLDLKDNRKFLKLGEYYILYFKKEENFDSSVSWKNTDYIFLVYEG